MIGLWGREDGKKITQLGFLTLSEDPALCPRSESDVEAEEAIEPEDEEEVVEEPEEEVIVIPLAPLPIASPPMIPIPVPSSELIDPASIIPEVIGEETQIDEVETEEKKAALAYQYEMRSLRSYYVWSGIIILVCMLPSLIYIAKE